METKIFDWPTETMINCTSTIFECKNDYPLLPKGWYYSIDEEKWLGDHRIGSHSERGPFGTEDIALGARDHELHRRQRSDLLDTLSSEEMDRLVNMAVAAGMLEQGPLI